MQLLVEHRHFTRRTHIDNRLKERGVVIRTRRELRWRRGGSVLRDARWVVQRRQNLAFALHHDTQTFIRASDHARLFEEHIFGGVRVRLNAALHLKRPFTQARARSCVVGRSTPKYKPALLRDKHIRRSRHIFASSQVHAEIQVSLLWQRVLWMHPMPRNLLI